jgi:hypothetical protein
MPSKYSDPFSPYRHCPKRLEERNPNTGKFDMYIVWDQHEDVAVTNTPVDRKTAAIQSKAFNALSSHRWNS